MRKTGIKSRIKPSSRLSSNLAYHKTSDTFTIDTEEKQIKIAEQTDKNSIDAEIEKMRFLVVFMIFAVIEATPPKFGDILRKIIRQGKIHYTVR